jgi:ABC-type lipoprotein export system ATPase subunit
MTDQLSPQLAEELLVNRSVSELVGEHPYLENYFDAIRLEVLDPSLSVVQVLADYPEEYFTDYGLTKTGFAELLVGFVERVLAEPHDELADVATITVLPGRDKDGTSESCGLQMRAGEVTCIVGPTGAGKSRLLEDIESLAQADTPTRRAVLINESAPSDQQRYDLGHRLVAQLTQNMNFVIDLPVGEFLEMHARSRGIPDPAKVAAEVVACANTLAGEQILAATALTQLSGGQSRAVMIADTALLSASPIVLIDEIENAGIDRHQALSLLVGRNKIVLMSTHDPVLALLGDRRVVIRNGGIVSVLETSPAERANLEFLTGLDHQLAQLRAAVRAGERLDGDLPTLLGLCGAETVGDPAEGR